MFRELFRQSTWYFAGYLINMILGLVGFTLWTRYFTVEEYGVLSLIGAAITFIMPFTKLGLHNSVVRFYSEIRSGKRKYSETTFYTTFFVGALIIGIFIGSLILIAVIFLAPKHVGNVPTYHLFIVSSLTFLLMPGNSIYRPFLRVEEKPKEFVFLSVFGASFRLLLSILFVFIFLLGLKGLYVSSLCLQLVVFLYVIFSLKKANKLDISSFSFSFLLEALYFGVPLIAAQLSNHLSNIGDRFVIQFLLGPEAVGLYGVAYGLTSRLKSLFTVWMFVVTPMYVKIWHTKGKEKTEEFLNTILDYYLMIAVPGIILFSIFGGDLLIFLASSKYQQADILLPFLSVPLLLHGAISIYTAGIFIHKKTKLIIYFTACSGLLNIILNFILIPVLGLVGAAVATLISYAVLIILANFFSSKFLKLKLNYTGIAKYITASLLAAVILRFITIEIFFGIIVKILIGMVIYLLTMWLFDGRIRQKVRTAIHSL